MEVNNEERGLVNIQSVSRLVFSWELPEREGRNRCGWEKPSLNGDRGRGPRRRSREKRWRGC